MSPYDDGWPGLEEVRAAERSAFLAAAIARGVGVITAPAREGDILEGYDFRGLDRGVVIVDTGEARQSWRSPMSAAAAIGLSLEAFIDAAMVHKPQLQPTSRELLLQIVSADRNAGMRARALAVGAIAGHTFSSRERAYLREMHERWLDVHRPGWHERAWPAPPAPPKERKKSTRQQRGRRRRKR